MARQQTNSHRRYPTRDGTIEAKMMRQRKLRYFVHIMIANDAIEKWNEVEDEVDAFDGQMESMKHRS